jgi:hypothetical protein
MLILLVEGNINADLVGRGKYLKYFSVMIESKKSKMGMGKVNRQGFKEKPGKWQRMFTSNFMLIRLDMSELKKIHIDIDIYMSYHLLLF